MIYAGIGSRETPKHVLDMFVELGGRLALSNDILRSGHAKGADMAFEDGCDFSFGEKEIYLPWKGFNGSTSELVVQSEEAFQIAESFHPAWRFLSDGGKKLQARNSHQVLGKDLRTPADFIVCWTPGGKMVGGTAQAIRIANSYGIPVLNAGKGLDITQLLAEIDLLRDISK